MEEPKGTAGRVYDASLAALGRAAKGATVLVVLGVLLVGLWQQYRGRDDVILEDFKVAPDLEKVGWRPEVVASKLADNIKLISKNADSSVGSNIGVSTSTSAEVKKSGVTANKSIFRPINFALASAESSLDIEVPQTRITVRTVFRYLFESLGIHPTRISGEITSRGGNLVLTIRVSEGGTTTTLPGVESGSGDPEALLSEGARSIYKHLRPVVLASYLYSSDPSHTKPATDLIQDCIYQDRDAALADVLWGIILLNESKYDEALAKFRDAEGHERDRELEGHQHDREIEDIIIVSRARAEEAKGEYDSARRTYENQMARSCSLLLLTNYAGFLANRGYLGEALTRYELLLDRDGESDVAHVGKGFVLEGLGQYEMAVGEYQKAIKLNPESASGYSNLANAQLNLKRYADAQESASKAVEVEPKSPSAHNVLGYVLMSMAQYDNAIKEFDEAVKLNPNFAYAYVNWADALLNQRLYDKALDTVGRALKIDHDSAAAHSERALILVNMKRYDEAITECELAVKRDERFVPAYDNWVAALLGKNDYGAAERKAGEIVGIAPDSADAHNILGYVLKSKRDYVGAVREFERAAELNGSNTYVNLNWTEALYNQGDFKGAEEKARRAIRLDDASADAHNWLGYALRSQGDYDGALAEHEKAIQLNPQNVYGYTGWAEAMLDKADHHHDEAERKAEYEAAERRVREVVAKDEYSVDARNLLGRVLRKEERNKEAIAEFEKVTALDRNNIYGYTGLTETYVEMASGAVEPAAREAYIEKALAAGRKAVDIDREAADSHGELGWALIAQGDYYQGRDDREKAQSAYGEALKEFVTANQLAPADPYPYVGMSNALRETGRCKEAEEKARRALELAPTLGAACGELNEVLNCLKRPTVSCG